MPFTPMNLPGSYDPTAINFGGSFSGAAGEGGLDSGLGGGIFGGPGKPGGWLANSGLGLNVPTFNLAMGGLKSLGELWSAFKVADIAKKQLSFTKAVSNANLANQTQSYNTSIADRARSRGAMEGQSQAQVADYITKNSLTQRTIG